MPYIGEIRMFGGNFAPVGWAFCNGQLLSIAEYDTVFTLLGTIYGGDGQSTFALPDLRGRAPINPGQGPGLPNYLLGQTGGTEANTLTGNNISHTHAITGTAGVYVSGEDGRKVSPLNNFPAVNGENIYSTVADTQMANASFNLTTGAAGTPSPVPVNNMQPYLAISYIICLEGIYPTPN
ncbi:phage tail protein [Niastella sp. OAS944]|uniref:phage tail protein n=1 Tax=Niastella sp. OAS944 TaxID=2664089 RepID=UPI00346F8D58|nr:microcystin-dependent protein [Chitinophagaceae bacterium OAS944]